MAYTSIQESKLIGGGLCFDFANTVGARVNASRGKGSRQREVSIMREKLNSYADLIEWGRLTGLLADKEARQSLQEAERRVEEASSVLERGIALREAIYLIFRAIVDQRQPDATALRTLNEELAIARSHERLAHTADGFTLEWDEPTKALDRVLWPVSRSAADFLTTGDLTRVKECGGEECGWLFLDTSRNRSRQWCDMQDCGNLAKVRRFRQRQQEAQ